MRTVDFTDIGNCYPCPRTSVTYLPDRSHFVTSIVRRPPSGTSPTCRRNSPRVQSRRLEHPGLTAQPVHAALSQEELVPRRVLPERNIGGGEGRVGAMERLGPVPYPGERVPGRGRTGAPDVQGPA